MNMELAPIGRLQPSNQSDREADDWNPEYHAPRSALNGVNKRTGGAILDVSSVKHHAASVQRQRLVTL